MNIGGSRDPISCRSQPQLIDALVARGARLVPGSGAAPSFFAYGPLGAANRSLFGFTLEESRIGAPSIYFSVESWSRSLTEDELGLLVERLGRAPGMGWLGEAIATRGAKALHRVRLDEVMRGPELVDALLEGLGAYMGREQGSVAPRRAVPSR